MADADHEIQRLLTLIAIAASEAAKPGAGAKYTTYRLLSDEIIRYDIIGGRFVLRVNGVSDQTRTGDL
jgi:hypothetical protein